MYWIVTTLTEVDTDVTHIFKNLETKVLTMGFIDDLLYPDDQVRALGERFKYHRHFFVPDNVGHDGFLLNFEYLGT